MPRTIDLSYISTTTNPNLALLATSGDTTGRVTWNQLTGWLQDFFNLNSLFSRSTKNGLTSLSAGTTATVVISGFKSYMLSKVSTNYPARVRIYADSTSSNIDFYRSYGSIAVQNSVCFVDTATTSGQLTNVLNPGIIGFNNDPSPNESIYVTITNNDTVARTISVDITLLKLER